MNTQQLKKVMDSDRKCKDQFVGVFASDELPRRINKFPAALIANVDKSSMPGSHWVAIYINQDQKGQYFDSYGVGPRQNKMFFERFLKNNCTTWDFNPKVLQGQYSAVCGQYCLFYLLHKCRGIPLKEILKCFSDNRFENDAFVNHFIREKFALDTVVFDDDMLGNQIARAILRVL